MVKKQGELPWRGWHVIVRFLPMAVLGIVFIVLGATGHFQPHTTQGFLDTLFLMVGGLLIFFAFLGMMFTKCPICYRSYWIVCLQEPDMRHDVEQNAFYRELTPPEEEG